MNEIINNRYELIRKIGTGGMAEVYLAHDRVLDREVALKVLRADLSSDPVALLRFQREAHSGSGLNDPNVVEIYDVGSENGKQYIVMEYVQGVTAKELIMRRGSLDTEEAVDFMIQLASGIAKAHAQGIVHRDIKPQNILVKGDGTLKVTDFGIAQSEEAMQLTKTDSVIGSIHYLAPECVRGEGASVQSDIYSMGIIFYEILTGKPPFQGEMPVEIAMKQIRDLIPSVQKFNPNIPNSIVNIINKATSKSLKHRYPNAEALIEDLSTCLSEERASELLWIPPMDENTNIDSTKTMRTLKEKNIEVVEKDDVKPKDNKKKRKYMIGGIILALLLVSVFAFWKINSSNYILQDLTGLTLQEAEESLKKHNIYISSLIDYEFSEEIESGKITKTYPDAGTKIEKGTQIRVVVSSGAMFEIQDYKGENIDAVKKNLEENTNLLIKVVRRTSTSETPGTIIGQEQIEPGTKIDPKERLPFTLIVATQVELQMPNLIGTNLESAKNQLEDKGVKVHIEKLNPNQLNEAELSRLKYDVVHQMDPMPGTYYVQQSKNFVTLFYYDGADKPKPVEPTIPENPNEGRENNQ